MLIVSPDDSEAAGRVIPSRRFFLFRGLTVTDQLSNQGFQATPHRRHIVDNDTTSAVENERWLRQAALNIALSGGAKFDTKTLANAESIYQFITAGNVAAPSGKAANSGAKTETASAPVGTSTAPTPSSDKPAATEQPSTTQTSPSDGASGFANDGAEITQAQFREAAIKYCTFLGADGDAALGAILKRHGADKMSAVQPADYAAIIAEFEGPKAEDNTSNPLFD